MKRPNLLRNSQFRHMYSSLFISALIGLSVQEALAEPVIVRQRTQNISVEAATDKSILEFSTSLSSNKARNAALELVKSMGIETSGEQLGPRDLIVNTPLVNLSKALKALPADKSAGVVSKSLFYLNGIPNEKTRVSFNSEVMVSYKPGISLDERLELETRFVLTNPRSLSAEMVRYDVAIHADEVPEYASKIWSTFEEKVKYVQPVINRYIELTSTTAFSADEVGDPLLNQQWHHNNDGTSENRGGKFDLDLDTPRSWNPNTRNTFGGDTSRLNPAPVRTTTGYYGTPVNPNDFDGGVVTVAVFDSGTDINHEDWLRNTTDSDPDPGGFSVIDPRLGFDYLDTELNPDTDEGDNHGTSVAGIIGAARNNGVGVSGIAPDIRLLSYRLVEQRASGQNVAGSDADFAAAILDAGISKLADLGNHSYGGFIGSDTESEAFQTVFINGRFGKGMVNFVSSGNNYTFISYPAQFESTFSVGATDRDGLKSGYSSFGGRLDFVGVADQYNGSSFPNVDTEDGVLTLDLTGNAGQSQPDSTNTDNPLGNYYNDFNGTSSAAPSVTGVAALILAEAPSFDAVQLFNVMANTADRVGDPLEYFGIENNASRFQGTQVELGDEGLIFTTSVFKTGNPNGFRKNFGRLDVEYTADGFSPFYGYGKPNPYAALTSQIAESPLRDYIDDIPVDDDDTTATVWSAETEPRVDLGELELVWISDFTTDFYDLFGQYLAGLEDPTAAGALAEAAILTREDSQGLGPWIFDQSRRVPSDEEDEISPKEIGFEFSEENLSFLRFEYFFPDTSTSPESGQFALPSDESFPILLSMCRPTRSEGEISFVMPEAVADDSFYNPRGRYLNNTSYTITSNENIEFPSPNTSLPLFMDITIRHELGLEDVSSATEISEGQSFGSFAEYEIIQVLYNNTVIGNIYGDSDDSVVFPLIVPTAIEVVTEDEVDYNFANWGFSYFPEKGKENLPFKTYRFRVPESIRTKGEGPLDDNGNPARDEDGNVVLDIEKPEIQIRVVSADDIVGTAENLSLISTSTGRSYLPETNPEDGEPIFIIDGKRDLTGYEIAQIKFWAADPDEDPTTGLTGKEIYNPDGVRVSTRGTMPVWSPAGNELFFVSNTQTATGLNEVRTALADGITRQSVGEVPTVFERNSTRLFQTVPEPGNPAGTNTSITSLSADGDSSLLGYIINDAQSLNHVFVATHDGFDERPLLPAENGISRDSHITSISFSPFSDEILLTSETAIEVTENSGTILDTVVSTKGTKLRGFQDAVSVENDAAVIFSAITSQGDRGIFLLAKNLSSPGAPNLIFTVADWPNSDESQPTISPDGRYIAFTSNTIDREAGTEPTASTLTQLYTSANIRQFLQFGAVLVIDGPLELVRDERVVNSSPTFPGGRYPKFEFFDLSKSTTKLRLAFEGINSNSDVVGEIGITSILRPASGDVSPLTSFITADIDPLPSDDEVLDNLASQVGRTDFNTKGDGWLIVVNSADSFSDPLSSRQGGALTLLSSGNTNTYGMFTSPVQYLRATPPSFALTNIDQFNHYLVRYYVRRTSVNAVDAPTFIGRVISNDGQDTHEVRVSTPSSVNNPYVPSLETFTTVDLLFQPSPFRYRAQDFLRYYSVTFELLNNVAGSDPLGGYVVDRVDLFRFEENTVEDVGTIKSFEFSTQQETSQWETFTTVGTPAPTYSVANGSLSITLNNSTNSVASWRSKTDTIEINPVGIEGDLFLRMRTDFGAAQTAIGQLPVLELKLEDASGRFSMMHSINSVAGPTTATSIAPTVNNDRRYYTYWRLSPGLQNEITDLTATFTASSVNRPGTTAQAVSLRSAEFDLIRFVGFPQSDPIYD